MFGIFRHFVSLLFLDLFGVNEERICIFRAMTIISPFALCPYCTFRAMSGHLWVRDLFTTLCFKFIWNFFTNAIIWVFIKYENRNNMGVENFLGDHIREISGFFPRNETRISQKIEKFI